MPDAQPDQSLHLPSLVIKNFRGIDELTIPRLGRVTLLAGKNGVGKTTVLDAVRVWADRGWENVFDTVLEQRGDSLVTIADNEKRTIVDRTSLFTNRSDAPEAVFSVGATEADSTFQIRQMTSREQLSRSYSSPTDVLDNIHLEMRFGDVSRWNTKNTHVYAGTTPPQAVNCSTLGPNAPNDETIERYWSEVALTSHEDRALEALNLITAVQVERIAALGSPADNGITQPRRMMAKVTGKDYQVPLRTLGDGAMRAYAVALALAKSSGGFLLIDEVENGIHHSVQPKFWEMVLKTAQRNNVQVIATTHSWDALRGFSRALTELELGDEDGVLYRIQKNLDNFRAVEYDKHELEIITSSGIEAR